MAKMNEGLEQELVLEMPDRALDISGEDTDKEDGTKYIETEESSVNSADVLERDEQEKELKKTASKRKKKTISEEKELIKAASKVTADKYVAKKQPKIVSPLDEMNPTEIAEFFFKMCYYPDSLLTDVKGFRTKEELVNSFYSKFGTLSKSEQQFIETRFQYEVERNATTRKMEITDKAILNALLVKENIDNTLIKDTVQYVSKTPIGDYEAGESLTTSTSISNLMSRNFVNPSKAVIESSDKVFSYNNDTYSVSTAKVYDTNSSEKDENSPVSQFAMMATNVLDKSKNFLLCKFGTDPVEIIDEEVVVKDDGLIEPLKNAEMKDAITQTENAENSVAENVKADKATNQNRIKGDGRAHLTVNNFFFADNVVNGLCQNAGYMSFSLREISEILQRKNVFTDNIEQSQTLKTLNLKNFENLTSNMVTKTVLSAKKEFQKIGLKTEYAKLAKTIKKSKSDAEKAGTVYGSIADFEDKVLDVTCKLKDKPIFDKVNEMKKKIMGAVVNAVEVSVNQTLQNIMTSNCSKADDKQDFIIQNKNLLTAEALNLTTSNKQANKCAKKVINNYLLEEQTSYNVLAKQNEIELAGMSQIKLKKD